MTNDELDALEARLRKAYADTQLDLWHDAADAIRELRAELKQLKPVLAVSLEEQALHDATWDVQQKEIESLREPCGPESPFNVVSEMCEEYQAERDALRAELAECQKVRDSWCAEYTTVRDEFAAFKQSLGAVQ